jgi:hypothetical protein
MIPSLNFAVSKERLRAIENDERVYTLDEKELQVHEAVLKPQVSEKEAKFLERSLSKSYPGMGFSEIIKKEKNKLTTELQQMEECMEMDKVEVIQHLIEVTETVLPQTLKSKEKAKLLKQHSEQAMAVEEKIDEEHVDAVDNCHSSPSLRYCIFWILHAWLAHLLHVEMNGGSNKEIENSPLPVRGELSLFDI